MTDPVADPESVASAALAQVSMREITDHLDKPPAADPADELAPLRDHLLSLRETRAAAPVQRADALDRLYLRGMAAITRLMPLLANTELPVPRKTRLMVRNMQDLLQILAEDLHGSLEEQDDRLIRGLRRPANLTLRRALHSLALHLLISDLVASPAATGIWRQLHQNYASAQRLQLTGSTPEGEHSSLQHVYYSTLLLGCAQPASFTSEEIGFVANYVQRFADHVEPVSEASRENPGVFWIDAQGDTPAVAYSRKAAAPETGVHYFSCDRLALLLNEQLAALEAGGMPQQENLPAFAATPAGRGVLRRLAGYWGRPGKRRFQRRRQNSRATLSIGLDNLWLLFQKDENRATASTSSWMITNESPDGYAIMHLAGKTGKLLVGDVTAIRTDAVENWQICLVRWALSENPEHLELGLQILAPHALPATLALPADADEGEGRARQPVLILPEIPALRSSQTLVVHSGTVGDQNHRLVLVIEHGNIEIREVRATHLNEQTGSVEVFAIERD